MFERFRSTIEKKNNNFKYDFFFDTNSAIHKATVQPAAEQNGLNTALYGSSLIF